MRSLAAIALLTVLAGGAPAASGAVEGPVTRLSESGGRPDVLARADGTALVAWERKPDVVVCRVTAAGACAVGSERTLAGSGGETTSRPFVFGLGGNRVVVVHGGCCPQRTYRFNSIDDGATFAPGVDFASLVPVDQGAALAGETVQLLGDPASGTVGYQQASAVSGGKAIQEATLDTTAGVTTYAVSSDGGRPFAAWGSFAAASPAGHPNLTASWAAPSGLTGVTDVRLAGPHATWLRGATREVARWSGRAFATAEALPGTPAAPGDADLAVDPAGGVHLAFSPSGSGAVCYATAPPGGGWTAPVLLGRDSAGVTGLQVSATAAGRGRVVFGGAAGVSTVALSTGTLTPNACGLAPTSLAIARAGGRMALTVALDPQGQDTTYRVEYGPTVAYGSATPEVAVAGGAGPVAATVELGALDPGRAHHARLVAANATGTAASADLVLAVPSLLVAVRARKVIRVGRCSGRRLRIELRRRNGAVPARAVVSVRGREPLELGRTAVRRGAVVVSRLPRANVRVAVRVRLDDGRVLRRAAAFRRC